MLSAPDVAKDIHNPAIENLIQSSLESQSVVWIPCSEITDIKSTPIDAVHYAIRKKTFNETLMLVSLGNDEICTPTLVSEFARIYSLPTHKYNNDVSHFRRYAKWLKERNKLIIGFTEYDNNYYMVANELFYRCYSRYGFCSVCGILRCSPVWCICGHRQLSNVTYKTNANRVKKRRPFFGLLAFFATTNSYRLTYAMAGPFYGWTSNNKQLDEFIKKSQLQANSPNDAYLEWIPFDCIAVDGENNEGYLYGLPTRAKVKLIPLEITDETHDLYYAEVNHLLMRHVY